MGKHSKIEWTDHTFNPWWGCVEVSPACDHCYARTFAKRLGYDEDGTKFPIWGHKTTRRFFGDKHWAEPLKWNAAAAKAGERRRVFCASMCDVMEEHGGLSQDRVRLYALIESTPWLDWLLLTKRPQNFRRFLPADWIKKPRPNVWGMTTVESPEYLWRASELLHTPFAVRGLSCEPLLGPLDLHLFLDGINPSWTGRADESSRMDRLDWVIIGGESGSRARPFNIDWARQTISHCQANGVAAFVKQLGSRPCCDRIHNLQLKDKKGGDMDEWPADLRVRQVPGIGTL